MLPAAAAIELIHTYSLIHDDLPAMDDDNLRRGMPTSHVKFGENVAILAGDGLFAEAMRLFCEHQGGQAEPVVAALGELVAAGVQVPDGVVLTVAGAQASNLTRMPLDEAAFRWRHNEDAMATEKLAEGIRAFNADAGKLAALIGSAGR